MSMLDEVVVPESAERPTARQIEIRRNPGVSAVIGASASAVAIAWFARAIETGNVVDWMLVLVLGALGALWLAAFVDARTPLLVADEHGARVRLGRGWVGLPWSAVASARYVPRAGFLRDARVEIVAHTPERLLAGLAPAAARQAALSTKLNGGPLALPLGWGTTLVGSDREHLGEDLARLREAGDAMGVVVRDAGPAVLTGEPAGDVVFDDLEPLEPLDGDAEVRERPEPGARRAEVERISARDRLRPWGDKVVALRAAGEAKRAARAASRAAERAEIERLREIEAEALREAEENDALARAAELAAAETVRERLVPSDTPDAARVVPAPTRAEVVRAPEEKAEPAPEAADADAAEQDAVSEQTVHPVAPVVLDETPAEPSIRPVIGPDLNAARTRLGLSVDVLAERTRIRPHVIEAIEVDDFAPCGGDFYARGHLRTLARTLGMDSAPLLVRFDERYAHAPVAARTVFEAELATTGNGPIRGTRGGPNWSVLVAAVMGVVLMWSVAQLILDRPAEEPTTPVLNGSGGPQGGVPVGDPVKVTVKAPASGATVVVRDASGQIVFNGPLAIGDSAEVEARAPVRVQSSDGSVTVSVDGRDRGPVGTDGDPAQGTYAGD